MNEIKEDSKIFRAWADFNKVSIKKVPDAETFQKLISLSPKLRAWYCSWSFDNSAFTQMPQSFRDAGITPQQWSELSANLPKINAIRKKASSEIEAKAKDFTTFVSNKELEVKEQLEKLETPYVKILKVNVTCLSIDDQLEILSKPENEREALEKSLLEKLRTKLFADLKANKFVDPFVFGDFKDLLTT